MADIDNTTSGIIWQWLNEHTQDVLDYYASKMRDVSQIELVNFDEDYHLGLLATYMRNGVRRVDNVKPTSLVSGLMGIADEIIEELEAAVAAAETKGAYAESQGDKVDTAISNYGAISADVQANGDYAKAQGDRAKGYNDHPWQLGSDGYLYVWDENHRNQDGSYGAMVQTNKVMFSWSDMSDEQKQAIITQMMSSLVFASKAETIAAANELT